MNPDFEDRKKISKYLHWAITLSTHILLTSSISETPCIIYKET